MRTELFETNNMKRVVSGIRQVERDGLTGHVRKGSKEYSKEDRTWG